MEKNNSFLSSFLKILFCFGLILIISGFFFTSSNDNIGFDFLNEHIVNVENIDGSILNYSDYDFGFKLEQLSHLKNIFGADSFDIIPFVDGDEWYHNIVKVFDVILTPINWVITLFYDMGIIIYTLLVW